MLIDIVEPIFNAIKMPPTSKRTKYVLKTLITKIKSINIQNVVSNVSLHQPVPKCELLITSSFVPEHIVNYIDQSQCFVTHEYTYKQREFKIIMVYENDKVERKKEIVNDMFKWLTMIVDMGSLPDKCARKTVIYCYLTPFKKELPTKHRDVLSYNNANSAVTKSCQSTNEICIFREEELFKVFIHETFHAFNLDFSLDLNESHLKRISKLFNIQSEFNIYETYAEAWAEIMNIVFLSDDSDIACKLLQAEVAFSLHQMNKVLKHMGLKYSDLLNVTPLNRNYKEETNVFCYYVLKTLILFYYSDFVELCAGSFKFKGNVDSFIKFVENKYNEPEFLNAVLLVSEKTTRHIDNTMRMTFWEN